MMWLGWCVCYVGDVDIEYGDGICVEYVICFEWFDD